MNELRPGRDTECSTGIVLLGNSRPAFPLTLVTVAEINKIETYFEFRLISNLKDTAVHDQWRILLPRTLLVLSITRKCPKNGYKGNSKKKLINQMESGKLTVCKL